MGGGYAKDIRDTVEIQAETVRIAMGVELYRSKSLP
jgi:hypothetical protein